MRERREFRKLKTETCWAAAACCERLWTQHSQSETGRHAPETSWLQSQIFTTAQNQCETDFCWTGKDTHTKNVDSRKLEKSCTDN